MKQYNFKINGHDYEVAVNKISEGTASVSVNGESYQVEVQGGSVSKGSGLGSQVSPAQVSPARYSATGASSVNTGSVSAAPVSAPSSPAQVSSGGGAALKSPLPGVILDIKVREGDRVSAGQSLVVLEAMKMENNIDAPTSGTVRQILKKQGDSVLEGDVLLTIE